MNILLFLLWLFCVLFFSSILIMFLVISLFNSRKLFFTLFGIALLFVFLFGKVSDNYVRNFLVEWEKNKGDYIVSENSVVFSFARNDSLKTVKKMELHKNLFKELGIHLDKSIKVQNITFFKTKRFYIFLGFVIAIFSIAYLIVFIVERLSYSDDYIY